MEFHEIAKKAREDLGMTVEELAIEIKASPKRIELFESNEFPLSNKKMEEPIRRALKIEEEVSN